MRKAAPRFHSNPFVRFGAAVVLLLALSFSASAQSIGHANFSAGAGFTEPIYSTGSEVNTGWNVDFRGGLAIHHMFDADLDFNYANMGLTNTVLAQYGEPNGGVGIWSLTFNPVVHLAPREAKVRPYVTAGYGLYHMSFSVSHPTAVQTIFCYGFFGCYPTIVGANQVVASNSTYRSGFNGGLGFDFPIGGGGVAFFAEARYSQMFMSGVPDVKFIPVTFGIRF
jgi:hypothetical protein